jgi:hypothetical protein
VRTLPLRTAPVAGEALDSWLEAQARRNGVTFGCLLGRLDLVDRCRRPKWMIDLTEHQLHFLSIATGIDRTRLTAMTLSAFDGVALKVDPNRRVTARTFPWDDAGRSRYCPECLLESDGRWQLAWRLRWSFACSIHHCLLEDLCPICDGYQRTAAAPRSLVPYSGRCSAAANGPQCQANLAEAQTTRLSHSHPVVLAQRQVHSIIADGCADFGVYADDPCSAREALADLSVLVTRVFEHMQRSGLAAANADELLSAYVDFDPPRSSIWPAGSYTEGKVLPKAAAQMAVAVHAALQVMRADAIASAAEAMRWLIPPRPNSGRAPGFAAGMRASRRLSAIQTKAYTPELGPATQLLLNQSNHTVLTRNSHSPTKTAVLVKRIPTVLWPQWAIRLQPSGDYRKDAVSQALSSAVLLATGRFSVADAISALNGTASKSVVHSSLGKLRKSAHWPAISAALTRLAGYLTRHDVPIDYERRRNLDYSGLLRFDTWRRLCEAVGRRDPGPVAAAGAHSYLFGRVSGLPVELAPGAKDMTNSYSVTQKARNFPLTLTPVVAQKLDEELEQFLRTHEIDEPLTWHPPLDLLHDLRLPNPDIDAVDLSALHGLVRQGICSVRAMATTLNTDYQVVRHLLAESPAETAPASDVRRRAPGAELEDVVTAEWLTERNVVQGKSARAIAHELGLTEAGLAHLARHCGVRFIRHPERPDPMWLYEQYVVKRRRLGDIAAERKVCPETVSRWIAKSNLPPAPPAPSMAAMTNAQARSLLSPALARNTGKRDLGNFSCAMDYPNLRVAGDALHIKSDTLLCQIRRLEDDLGGRLLIPAKLPLPMAPTYLGAQVISAVRILEKCC